MKKFFLITVLVAVLSFNSVVFAQDNSLNDKLFQVALLQSLMQGEYNGVITVADLKNYGDTGIGTFQSVNGEMIVLDGNVYQALWDGSVKIASDDETVPFSNVTFFEPDVTRDNVNAASIEELKNFLTSIATEHGRNQFYMAKVTGKFPLMNVRSELPQKEPFKHLNDALKTDQREFSYQDIEGTVVALYCPDYMDGLNTPGWHLHFISKNKDKGGHVLTLSAENCSVALDVISEFAMIVPNRQSFNDKDLAADMKKAIQEVEVKN